MCCKCKSIAVWMYMPSDGGDRDHFYCDNCVRRGCSCMTNEDGSDILDDKNRQLPCCEYDYNEKGYDDES